MAANIKSAARSLLRLDVATHNRTTVFAAYRVHLDCAVVKIAAAFTTVTLPSCLVGVLCTVRLRLEDFTYYEYTATPASTTLTVASSIRAHVGIAMLSRIQTMRLEYPMPDGTAQGRAIKISSVILRVLQSQGGEVKVDYSGSTYENAPYATAVTTYSGDIHVSLKSSHCNPGIVFIRHDNSWPFTLTAFVVRADVGGDPSGHYIVEGL